MEESPRHEYGVNWVVMVDTENNEFCLCDQGWQPQGTQA